MKDLHLLAISLMESHILPLRNAQLFDFLDFLFLAYDNTDTDVKAMGRSRLIMSRLDTTNCCG